MIKSRFVKAYKYLSTDRLHYSILFLLFLIVSNANAQLDLDFNIDRGYYFSNFNLVLSTNDPTATIRYTTNGTAPTPSSGSLYSAPIPINTTTYVRAIAFASYDTTKVLTHTYIFPQDVINQPNSVVGYPSSDYAFDNSIKNHPTYGPQLVAALSDVPSLSLVMKLSDFANVHDNTSPIEVATSVEVLLPNGQKGYQANGGIERAGGSSFNSTKRNFRLSFKSIYGDSKFDFPLFGKENAESFDQIALRPGFHGCMHLGVNHVRGGVNDLADQVVRDLQANMADDNVSISGSFMHLYINGIYWGVYNPTERGINAFAESYYCGDKDDWDSIKRDAALDGTITAWNQMKSMVNNLDMANAQNYADIQEYVDVTQFTDYVILTNYGPHADDHVNAKNSFATRNRTDTKGFKFWMWDTEPSLGHYWTWSVAPFGSRPFNFIFNSLLNNSDYKTLVGDRLQCHCFEDGALTPAKAQEAYDAVFDSTEIQFIAEAGRWAALAEYNAFVKKRDTIVNQYLPGRTDFLVNLYRANGAYPNIDAVQYNQFGGVVSALFPVTLSNPNGAGTIYYTTDGTDPRASGGAISSTAQNYTGSFTLPQGAYTIKARVRVGSTWSAMCPAIFYVDQNYQDLVINEIHYNPNDFVNPPDTTSGKNFEFLEIKNCGEDPINVINMEFEKGLRLKFEEDLIVEPNGFIVIAEDEYWFQQKYGFAPDAVYKGKLDNSGENLWLVDPFGNVADSITYNDKGSWPNTADKGYYSLALMECSTDNALGSNWNIQSVFTTPKAENYFTNFGEHDYSGIVINEIHYNPKDSINTVVNPPDTISGTKYEFIELKNISSLPIDLTGVFFSRGIEYEFADSTILNPGEFIVLAEDKSSFLDRYGFPAYDKYDGKLSNDGEIIWLSNADGVLLDAVDYDESFPWDTQADGGSTDYSLALINGEVDNDTRLNWQVQCATLYTPGEENVFPCFTGLDYTGLVINEFTYSPAQGNNHEFIEIMNSSNVFMNLEEVRLSTAITYKFKSLFLLPGDFVVVARDSSLFHNTYGVAPVGKYSGGLSSNGETIILEDLFGQTIDSVTYGVSAPWNTEPVQGIKSLALIDPSLNNALAESWCTQDVDISPKAVNVFADSDSDGNNDCLDLCPAFDDTLLGTACDDGDSCTPSSVYSNCDCIPVENAALNGTASMSSQLSGFVASRLIDGVTSNDATNGLAHTTGQTQTDWVEIDLGSNLSITTIVIHNRVSCCSDRLSNAYVMVADTPFPTNTNLSQSISNADFIHQLGDELNNAVRAIEINGSGRYVRIQKSGMNAGNSDAINLKEIEVFTPYTVEDTDNDGVCDIDDICAGFDDSIDVNNNGIPDGCEDCSDYILDLSGGLITQDTSAQIAIETNGKVQSGNTIDYHAGNEVELTSGFEVESGAVFHAFIMPCE